MSQVGHLRRILKLPSTLAHQIAAGEVIERPASVVKELVENALDAGAHKITVEIVNGGKKRICVTDDGQGIHKDDLHLALSAHATSKVYDLDELESVHTLGFRGEALASISAVSRFKLASRHQDAQVAMCIERNGGEDAPIAPSALSCGTHITVDDLFYNVPARQKFLMRDATEQYHIENYLKRLVLSRFDVAFEWKVNGKRIWQLPKAPNEMAKQARLTRILGKHFLQHARWIDVASDGFRLYGWCGLPSGQVKKSDHSYFYINHRLVKDKRLTHAIKLAYEDFISPGYFPCFVLYFECDPSFVDVNVHPAKLEVRFKDTAFVHHWLHYTLSQCLQMHGATENTSVAPSKERALYLQNHAHKNQILKTPAEKNTTISQNSHVEWIDDRMDRANATSEIHQSTPHRLNTHHTQTSNQPFKDEGYMGVVLQRYVWLQKGNEEWWIDAKALRFQGLLHDVHTKNVCQKMLLLPYQMIFTPTRSHLYTSELAKRLGFIVQSNEATIDVFEIPKYYGLSTDFICETFELLCSENKSDEAVIDSFLKKMVIAETPYWNEIDAAFWQKAHETYPHTFSIKLNLNVIERIVTEHLNETVD